MNKIIEQSTNSILSRGKSLTFVGCWLPHIEYRNDSYTQHFVEHGGKLWGCIETNTNQEPSKTSHFWRLAASGVKGDKGKEIIDMYEMSDKTYIDSETDVVHNFVMVVYSDGTNEPFELKIQTKKGDTGPIGPTGATGERGATPEITIDEVGDILADGVTISSMPREFAIRLSDLTSQMDTQLVRSDTLMRQHYAAIATTENKNAISEGWHVTASQDHQQYIKDHTTAAEDHATAAEDHERFASKYDKPTGGIPWDDLDDDLKLRIENEVWLTEAQWAVTEIHPNITYNIYEEES